LSPRDGHPFRSKYVADLALGDGLLELVFEKGSEFLLSESRVLSFPFPQPGPTLGGRLVRVAVAMVNERLPGGALSLVLSYAEGLSKGRASLTVTAAELRKVVPAEGEVQFLAEALKVLSLVEALEQLLLGQGLLDLTSGVAFHGVPPCTKITP